MNVPRLDNFKGKDKKETAIEPAKKETAPARREPRNAMERQERQIQEQMSVAAGLGVPRQFIHMISDKHGGPSRVYVGKEGIYFALRRRADEKKAALRMETKWHKQEEGVQEDSSLRPEFVAEVVVQLVVQRPDGTEYILDRANAFGTANRGTVKPYLLAHARELAETRATVRAAQKITGCAFGVLIPEEGEQERPSSQEIVVEAEAETAEPAKRDRSFYADDPAPPASPPKYGGATLDAKIMKLEQLLKKGGRGAHRMLLEALGVHQASGASELPAEALDQLLADLEGGSE